MYNPLENAKSVNDIVLDESDYIGSLHFTEWHSFHLFEKVIDYFLDEPMSFDRRGIDRTYDIHIPCFECP